MRIYIREREWTGGKKGLNRRFAVMVCVNSRE